MTIRIIMIIICLHSYILTIVSSIPIWMFNQTHTHTHTIKKRGVCDPD